MARETRSKGQSPPRGHREGICPQPWREAPACETQVKPHGDLGGGKGNLPVLSQGYQEL